MHEPYIEHGPFMNQGPAQMQTQTEYRPAPAYLPPSPTTPQPHPTKTSRRLRTGAILLLTGMLAVIFGVGLFAGWEFGRTSTVVAGVSTTSTAGAVQSGTNTLSGSSAAVIREAVIAKVRASVVQVNVTMQRSNAIGSGVIIDGRGYIVTNNHVVAGAQSIEVVLADGTKLPAQLVGADPSNDLAVLKITTNQKLTVATFGDSSKLQVGQDVIAIGNPLGITQSVTNGIVSALGRSVSEGQNGVTIPDAIQTDAPINPGNSGGALFDMQGNLIGIPTLGAIDSVYNTPANGVGFAIPSNRVQSAVQQIIATGSVTH